MANSEKYIKYKTKYLNLKEYLMKRSLLKKFPSQVEMDRQYIDEVHFWGRQMLEHAFFLFLGLEDRTTQQFVEHVQKRVRNYPTDIESKIEVSKDDYKFRAYNLYISWLHFMNETFKDVDKDKIVLSVDDYAKIKDFNFDKALKLLKNTLEFNNELKEHMAKESWSGWIYASLLEHMQEESIYFYHKIKGPPFKIQDEVNYINEHHASELAVAAHLVDPKYQDTIKLIHEKSDLTAYGLTRSQSEIIKGLSDVTLAQLVELSQTYLQEIMKVAGFLGESIKSKTITTIIHPVLAAHVEREFKRFEYRLNEIKLMLSQK